MTTKKIYRVPARDAGVLSGLKRRLNHSMLLVTSALLLSACTGETSDELAQEPPFDLSLAQCEVAEGGVVGTPTDPVIVDGVETLACLLNADAGQVGAVNLKSSHNYENLVWVLDGTYEIGESKSYATLAELQADTRHGVGGYASKVYAKPGTVVVVHRNGSFAPNIVSIDDDNIGGGEWGGVVVNGMGYHPDCGTTGGADNFCNVQGEWGYYGGLSQQETREGTRLLGTRNGFTGYAAEAGGELSGGERLSAAITVNAPHLGQSYAPQGVFYSATNGLELNGGALSIGSFRALGNQGHALYWHSGFGGEMWSSIIHHQSDLAAIKGGNSGSGDSGVSINGLTLVDQSLNAGSALALAGGGNIGIDNMVVQGFATCLNIGDGNTSVAVANSAFYCGETTAAAEDGSDYAAQALAQAENFYTLNPDLSATLALDNVNIEGVAAASLSGSTLVYGYELGLYYEPCYGAGALLEETVAIGQSTYQICELKGQVSGNLYFDDDINDVKVAWRINGAVTLGSDFTALDAAQQQAALAAPGQIVIDGGSKILLSTGSTLALNPNAALRVLGTAQNPVELAPQGLNEHWGGITINGLVDNCASSEICALAQQRYVDINYLRLLNAGSGQPALTLNEVSAAGQINHLDIADSASAGLSLNGGAVNIDNLLVSDVVGNQVQWASGYRGTLQYAILQAGDNSLGHALHGSNDAANHDAAPRSRPVMANITVKGTDSADTAILLEQGSGLLLYNSVVADFNTCLDIDDPATANLQTSNPAQIFFDNVVLDCGATIAEEDEEAGMDYAASTQGLSGVYQVPAVLDTNFVASGSEIPGIESSIDFALAGGAAMFLNAGVGYMGSVRDSVDDWYLGWSDSVGVVLAAECDFMGVLEDDFVFESDDYYPVYLPDGGPQISSAKANRPVCGLRGTITEDLVLSTYTGSERLAAEAGEQISEDYLWGGSFPTIMVRDPVPTVWLLNGLVRVGEGHLEITDLAQLQDMKENPVTLEIGPSADVVATAGGALHVTRGGALLALGEVALEDDADTDGLGPVGLSGTGPWRGLIVDGFGRNNQCPDAMAEPGTNICNIQGEFGYYGGYDNSHGNLWIENLELIGGRLQLNSVGGGSEIHNFLFSGALTDKLEESFGKPVIDIDGGAVNFRNVNIGSNSARAVLGGSVIKWNHGYQGTLQSVWLMMQLTMAQAGTDADGNYRTIYQETDGDVTSSHYYPVIHGINGAVGHENDLPRSAPTIANLSLRYTEAQPERYSDALSSMIELSGGSGLYLHNSVLGTNKTGYDRGFSTSHPYPIGFGWAPDWCIKTDGSVDALVGEEVIFDQVALGCTQFSNNAGLEQAFDTRFTSKTVTNVAGTASDLTTVKNPSEANADIYRFGWTVGTRAAEANFQDVEGVVRLSGWENRKYATPDVINLGEAASDYSASKTVNKDFILDTNYLGTLDYFIPINAGYQISAD
ncbi:hypothetical protein GNX18_15085 [Microbulbifer sp. SH-1]|uniref:hypothetical protein n=1 Tax=Microbulbifer sp. SH-1 TaxID=2681547 RepID=UPI00140AF437|nr:hypothetical protein [Microbulbifer sp. SH-1]QIL90949.1 hypothetical protein GNX18_15085 [Microbulbifer sp. SH-1]